MFSAGISLESVRKLFSKGTDSQKLCKHTDGCFNEQSTCRLQQILMPRLGRLHYAGQMTLSDLHYNTPKADGNILGKRYRITGLATAWSGVPPACLKGQQIVSLLFICLSNTLQSSPIMSHAYCYFEEACVARLRHWQTLTLTASNA